MPPQGMGHYVSPEFLYTLSVAVPAFLMTWWVIWGAGWLWRRTLWQQVGPHLDDLGLESKVTPLLFGWRVQRDDLRVDYRGGLSGPHTIVRSDTGRQRFPGLIALDSL